MWLGKAVLSLVCVSGYAGMTSAAFYQPCGVILNGEFKSELLYCHSTSLMSDVFTTMLLVALLVVDLLTAWGSLLMCDRSLKRQHQLS